MADQLCTTAQVKARLTITDATDDALISELIDQVSDWISDYTGRKLVPEAAATYVVDTVLGHVIPVPRGIRTVTTLSVAATNQPDSGGTYSAVTASDILLRPAAMDRRPGWPATEIRLLASPLDVRVPLRTVVNGAKIVGDFGFAVTPPEIVGVCIDAVVAAYAVRRQGASGVIGADELAVPPWSQFFGPGSPQRGVLNRYRLTGFA